MCTYFPYESQHRPIIATANISNYTYNGLLCNSLKIFDIIILMFLKGTEEHILHLILVPTRSLLHALIFTFNRHLHKTILSYT